MAGVGVAVPGAVEIATGVVLRARNLDWENVPLKQTLEADLGVPVEVELDVRAAALGAMLSDLARDVRDFVYVTIGTGIGAGIVIDGKLHHGAHFCSGEIGHCVLVEDGPRCGCGQRGCFEALAAGAAIAERAGRTGRQNPSGFDNGRPPRCQRQNRPQAASSRPPWPTTRWLARQFGGPPSISGAGWPSSSTCSTRKKSLSAAASPRAGNACFGLIRQYMAQYTLHRGPKETPIVLCPDLDNLPVVGAANLIFTRRPAMNPPLSFVSPVSHCEHRAFSRTLRDLADLFCDPEAVRSRLSQDNPVIYEFHEYVAARKREELVAATCTLFPGKVGKEFHMTRGHFHDPANFAEVYYVESGKGLLLLQSREGHFASVDMHPGTIIYVPPDYFHRYGERRRRAAGFFRRLLRRDRPRLRQGPGGRVVRQDRRRDRRSGARGRQSPPGSSPQQPAASSEAPA